MSSAGQALGVSLGLNLDQIVMAVREFMLVYIEQECTLYVVLYRYNLYLRMIVFFCIWQYIRNKHV